MADVTMRVSTAEPEFASISPTELTSLRNRLREAEETLAAIRDGEVDAVVVRGSAGQQVYTLDNADRPYRALIEQMQDGAITISADGSILYCNQRFASMVGIGAEQIMGAQVGRFMADDAIGAWKALSNGMDARNASGEYSVLQYQGDRLPCMVSLAKVVLGEHSEPVVCAVLSDLTPIYSRSRELQATNRQLAEEINERHRAEGSLQFALDAAGMGSWDLDLAKGEAHRSQRHDEIFGHKDLGGPWGLRDALKQFVPEDAMRVSEAFELARASGLIEIEGRIVRATDLQERWLRITGRTFYDDSGAPTRIAGVISDVTERRAVEERLRQAQKIEAIGQLTGGVAHDFNNLLQVVSGGLQLVGRGIKDPTRLERVLKGMRQAVERGSGLSRQLLAFSRRQTLSPVAIDLKRQIGNMREMLERSLRGDITIETSFPNNLWPVKADPGELELVVLNLAVNARDAMPHGGNIRISARNVGNVDEVLTGEFVCLDVADSGTGMPPEVLAHAFEPFFTTKEVGKGSGLGLAQAHGFAQASGGTVRITSVIGSGTVISVFLPRTQMTPPPVVESSIDQQANSSPAASAGQVLLVEDDDEVAALAAEMLTELGYQSTRVATAEAALGALANDRVIDVVFSDVIMPGAMNGVELALEICRRRPELPVILTSGFAGVAMHSAREHELRILKKPYTFEELRDAFAAASLSGDMKRNAEH
jgi:PAS domain S-box-containing protein